MSIAKPSQRLQDWISQQWCIVTGRRVEPDEIPWLMGPFGNVDGIEDRYVDLLASSENLVVRKNEPDFGLLESVDVLNLSEHDLSVLRTEIVDFYEHTLNYEFEVWSQWQPMFKPFAGLIAQLYSKRIGQLNLPLNPIDTARGMQSQIYKLVDQKTGRTRYTVWYRHLQSSGQVIYSGVYSYCTIPDGRTCLKITFPLPQGNATVVMGVKVEPDGSLLLSAQGKEFGDPGFYFLLKDAKNHHWARYISTFNESITVFVDSEHVLRADHLMNLWGRKALHLHYRMNPAMHANAGR